MFLILSAYSEITLKLFYRSWRIHPKFLIELGECAKRLFSVNGDYGDFGEVLFIRKRQKHFSVLGDKRKEYKCIRIKCQEYYAC
jgi:hypothetical protein